jgi:hypothetical protein
MGKRKGRKKRKLKYSKSQFGEIICSGCRLCSLVDPDFCYCKYKADPKTFMDYTYGVLRNPTISGKTTNSILAEAFCDKCGNIKQSSSNIITCRDFPKCSDAFDMQLDGLQSIGAQCAHNLQFGKKYKNAKKKKKKYICSAYPTFFSSEGWKDEIRSIIDGDKNNEQNRSEESPEHNKNRANKMAQSE